MSIKRTPASLRAVKEESGVRFKPNAITAALLATFGTLPGWAQANDITVHSGWTGTTIGTPTNGVTDITTTAVRGGTGFNQFGTFTVGAGNTVNLNVPTNANTLVNLVHNARAEINGTLNGLKDGKIGGNIIFADPHGMVVGASGVVNVGSLTVTTPSAAQMSQLAAVASGSGDADRVAVELMAGTFNDGSGTVEISGKVNTAGSINLFGASALVASGASLQAGTSAAETVFANTVNLQGVSVGTGVAQADGSIRIVGRDGVQVSGELAALMADNSGGNVQITATNSIELKDKARLLASGAAGKNAGDVTLKAASIKLSGDARVSTAASGTGTAGNITLSAYSDVSLKADSATTVDQLAAQLSTQAQPLLAATRGKAEVVIGAGASLDAGQADDSSKAGNVSITAFGFDRQMSGYADAKGSINVAGSITGKDISLRALSEARVTGSLLGSLFSSDVLKADFAKLKSANNWTDAETWSAIIDTLGNASSVSAQASSIGTLGLDPANWSELAALLPYITVAIANANADVTLASTAVLKASQDIDISAETTRLVDTSTGSIPFLNGVLPFNLGVAYGRISGTTLVDVKSNASLNAGHDLAMQALSDNTLDLKATATNSKDGDGGQGTTTGFAFGMAHSDISTLAQVADGALLNVGNDVSLTALTQQSLNNEVEFKSIGQGAAGGPAIALTLFNSTTRAAFDADLSKGRNLNVSAINLIDQQNNSSSVQAGKSATDYVTSKAIATAKPITDYLAGKVKTLFSKDPNPTATKPTDSQFRLASALAIGIADHQAEAIIGSGASKPVIKVDGDVAVQALQRQSDMHNSAESTVNADVEKDDGVKTSLSVAAVYSQLDQSTRALIGDGSDITAGRIGVAARNQQLLNLDGLDRWSSLEAIYTNLKNHASSLPDVPGKLSSSYANSTSEAEELSIAGSLSVVVNSLDSTAWVGDNVKLTATNTDKSAWSSKPLAGLVAELDDKGVETDASKALRGLTFDWHAPLAVQANTQVQQLGITGNFWWGLFNNNSDGGAAGAGVNVQISGNSAIAGIGAGGTLRAEKLAINAEQDELIIGISPSAGKGASVAGNGAVVVSVTDSTVHASIHNSTAVTADQVGISAEHKIGMWSAAGALSASENTGIGASVAVNVLTSDVQALVGNNLAMRPGALGAGATSTVKADWKVNELLVDAKSSGQSGAFGVAGALAKTEEEQKQQDEVAKTDGGGDSGATGLAGSFSEAILQTLNNGLAGVTGGLTAASDKAASVKDSIVSVPEKLSGYWDKFKNMVAGEGDAPGGDSEPGSKLSLAIAGSGSINVSGQKNRAHLGDIVLDPRDPAKGSKVTVLSLNQTNQFSGAGGGALTLAGGKKSEFSSAIAGAVAYNHLYNVTESLLDGVTLNNNDLLKVEAASAGDQIAMGLGLAVATAGETNVAVALSGSGAVVTNTTRAAVVDSTINQRSSAPGSIEVTAYDRSRLLVGGGSFAGSKGKGTSVGGSLALGVISNQLLAEWLGSTASNFATFDLSANSAARVLAGAIAVAVSTGNESSAGSGSLFVVVLNNQIKARVDANHGKASSLKGGAVNVDARSVSNLAALDSLFSAAAQTALKDSELDLDGTATAGNIDAKVSTDDDLTGGTQDATTTHDLYSGSNSGEAVLGIAGSVAGTGGKAGAGGALGVIYTGSVYKASVANTGIDLTGNLAVNASNDTQVLAAAIAAGGGNNVGVAGSGTIVIARGSVEASLDMADQPTLKAKDLSVTALKKGASYSLAGSIAGSSQSASVGGAFSLSDMQHDTRATVSNGTYLLTGDATLAAAQNSRIVTAALSGSVSGSGVAVGGALTYNRIADTTSALLQHVNMSARNLAIAASQPDLGASIWSVAFNLAAAGGSAGVGAAVAVNLIDAQRSAGLFDSTINLSGDATLSSALDGEIWGLGVDAAGGNTAGVGGSIVVNNISGSDTVSIERTTLTTSGSGKTLSVDASGGKGLTIASLTGSITGGGTAAVGGAISVNRIDADRTALLKGGSIGGFSTARVLSGAEQNIYAVAVAGSGAGNVAVNGSSTSNILDGSERAAIDGTTFTNTGSLTVSAAQGDRTIWSLAGAVSGAGTTAVGVANANNIILAKREAEILGANLTLTGPLLLESGGAAHIRSAAVGIGGGGTAAAGASIAINVIQGEENALLSGSQVSGASSVNIQVIDGDADIKTFAGNVQGAGTGAGGAAVAISTVEQKRQAKIVDSLLTLSATAPMVVQARTQAQIDTIAVAGAASGTGSVAFSNTSNNIAGRTLASVENSGGSAGKLSLLSSDTSTINALSGGVAGAGTAAVGAATAINRVDSEIESRLTGSKNAGWALQNLVIDADSAATIRSAAVSGAGSGTAAVVGSFATNIIRTSALGHLGGGANVVAQHNIGISASNRDSILSAAGAVAVSGNAGVGASATVNLIESQTKAYIDGSSTQVSALGKSASDTLTIDSGELLNAPSDSHTYWAAGQFNPAPNLGIGTRQITGLGIQASSLQQVGQLSVTASAALVPLYSAAVAGLVNTSVIAGSTAAYIDAAKINQADGAGSEQNVRVGANSHSFSAGYLTSLSFSLGAAALSATLDSTVISRTTEAYLKGVSLKSRGATEVNAGSSQYASSVIASAGGGIVGGAGSAGLIVLKGDTQARVEGGSNLTVGSLKVAAAALQRISPNAAAFAGGAVGVGGTFVMAYNQSKTRAWVGEALDAALSTANTVVAGSGAAVTINASNDTRLLLNAAGVSAGGAAVAGSAAISVLETITEAGASQADFGTDGARIGSLDIQAKDNVSVMSNAGSLAVGGTAVGGTANVLVANSATRALFDRGTLRASGIFNVKALREGDFQLNSVSGSAGSTALGGSLGLLLLGSGSTSVSAGGETSNPLDELDKGGKGTLTQANSLGSADKSGDIGYQQYSWNATRQQYELVESQDAAAKSAVNSGSQSSIGDRLTATTQRKHETTARVSDSSIVVGGAAAVSAQDKLYSSNLAGSAVLGMTGAAGGAFAFTLSNALVSAQMLNSTVDAGSLNVSAASLALRDKPAVNVQAVSGAAGFGAGLGAAVGVAVMNNLVNATLGGSVTTSGTLKGSASDSQGIDVQALGVAAAGGTAAGLVLGVAQHDSQVALLVSPGATLSGSDITLGSSSQGPVALKAQGAAGGLAVGLNASVLVARDASSATLDIGSGAKLLAGNGLNLSARATPQVKAESLGVALGGALGAGATVIDAIADATARLSLAANSQLQAKSASLAAQITRNGDNDTLNIKGIGVSGGIGLSANAVVATARNGSTALLESADSSLFTGLSNDGIWSFQAATDVRQRASVEGYAAGLLTLGASVAKVTSSTSTQALVGGRFAGASGTLKVGATAVVDNLARATAGQGGLISGAASLAITADTGTTKARLYAWGADDSSNRNALFKAVELSALHQSLFNAFVDSVNASLVGASGAHAQNDLTLTTTAELAGGSRLETYAYEQSAKALVTKAQSSDYNVRSGSGGVVDAAAAQSVSSLALNTSALVGANAYLHLIGDFRLPVNLLVSAYNQVTAYDKVRLDSGGAIAIALAKSQVNLKQSKAGVTIGENADLSSIGDIVLSGSGDYLIDTAVTAKTWGLAGAARGSTLASVIADYDVDIAKNATLLGYGDIRLYAGRNAAGRSSQATLTARTDLWNNTAFPVSTKPDADAAYVRTSDINVASGAQVNSVGDVFAYADKGWGNLLGKGVAKDLYTEALSALGLSVEIESGSATNTSTSVVRVDGALNSGYYNKRSVHIEGLEYWVNGVKKTLAELAAMNIVDSAPPPVVKPKVTTSDSNITYRLSDGVYSQFITQRLADLDNQLADYGLSAVERTAMTAEQTVLRKALDTLYTEMGGSSAGGASLARDQSIWIFELDPILAKPGNVFVTGDALVGSGKLNAPGDAAITVTNDSSAFLRIHGLEVPYREGGQLLFNDASLSSATAINSANATGYKGQANFSAITVSGNSPDPVIAVVNNYNPSSGITGQDGLRAPAPDIYIAGRIFNQRGLVTVNAKYGSIYANADIRGKTLAVTAGRDFVLNSANPFFHIGGDPATNNDGSRVISPAAGSGVVAGNNVVISAQYLNINGLVQSGVPFWSATIDASPGLDAIIIAGQAAYDAKRGPSFLPLKARNLRTGELGYGYDFATRSIVLDSVDVAGGYMELTGYIMSTGNGQLNVLDGYSQVLVRNNSNYQIGLNQIDLGSGTEGTLRINDVRRDGAGSEYVWSSIYTRDFNTATGLYNVMLRQGYSNNVLTQDNVRIGDGRTATYTPVSGRSYVWLTGKDSTVTTTNVYYKDSLWGAFNVGEGNLSSSNTKTDAERPIDGAEYMGTSGGLAGGVMKKETETQNTGDANTETSRWNTCAKKFIWCQVKRSWMQTVTTTGQKVINRYTVAADNAINIDFIGHDSGLIDVDSTGNVVVLGSLFNQTGDTKIKTTGSLTQGAAGAVVQAKNLTLDAGTGIGSSAQALRVQVGNLLSAQSLRGDVAIAGINGGLNISRLDALAGNLSLKAQGNITATNGAVLRGHGISLISTHGAIGAAGALLNIDTNTDNGVVTSSVANLSAQSVGGVFLNEVSGDLSVDQVISGGDVHLKVANGDIVDGNTSLSYDERDLAKLRGLWREMGLTGAEADAALAEQKAQILKAGQASYARYWQLRDGQVFDLDQVAFSSDQIEQIKVLLKNQIQSLDPAKTEAQVATEVKAKLAAEQLRVENEYLALHEQFGGAAYDASYQYALSASELDALDKTAKWSEDQLRYSLSDALSRREGSQVKIERDNIQAANITLEANRVGRVLADDVLVDLGAGAANLTQAQLAALGGAELDDIHVDDKTQPNKLRIVQRDDLNVTARGTIAVTAKHDVYLGGSQDFNIYNVQGDTVRIKTDGNIESARGNNVVVTGADVVLEAFGGTIGGNGSLHINVSGDLTAYAGKSIALTQAGDLSIQRLTAGAGVNLNVGGNLMGRGLAGEHIKAGGDILLKVGGNLGSATQRIQLNSQTDRIDLDVDRNAYIGGRQGTAQSGNLNIRTASVDGLLDIAQTETLTQSGDWSLGALLMDLGGNWSMGSGTSVTTQTSLDATLAHNANLGALSVTGSNGNLSLKAKTLQSNADGVLWKADTISLTSTGTPTSSGDIGALGRYLRVQGRDVNVSASGKLFLELAAGVTSGKLISQGGLSLKSMGDLSLAKVQSKTAAVQLRGLGVLKITELLAYNDIDLDGGGLSLASTTVTSEHGNLLMNLGGAFSADNVNASQGLWSLKAGSADIGRASIGHAVDMTLVGDLGLDQLSAGGAWTLDAHNASVGLADVTGQVNTALSGDLQQLTRLVGQSGWTLKAVNATVGEADLKGAVQQTVTGVLNMTDLKAGGLWNLASKTANVTKADVIGAVDMTQTGLLTLGTLLGASTWTLDGTDASIGDATVNGQVNTTLSGSLLQLNKLVGQSGWTLKALNATVGEADLKGAVQQTVTGVLDMSTLKAGGSWTLDGHTSTVGTADITGAVDIDQRGLLTLTRLTGKGLVSIDGTDANIGSIDAGGLVDMTLTGSLDLDRLDGKGGWNLHALNATVGEADLEGAVQQTVTGVLNMTDLKAGGLWNLASKTATVTKADITGAVDMTQTGLLTLGTLLGASTWTLNGTDASIGSATLTGQVNTTLSGDLQQLTKLVGQSGWTLNAVNVDIGSADLQGNVLQTVTGVLDMDTLVSKGLWTLEGHTSTVGSADVIGAVDMTQTGLLTLGTLLGASTWTLNGTDASIGNATVTGQVNTTLSGSLQLAKLVGQSGWTLSAVNADIGSADLQGDVRQTLTHVLDIDTLDSKGLWTLKGHTSTIGTATVDKAVDITQTGLLKITSLTGKDSLVLNGTDAVIGTAAIADTSAMILSGDLKLASLTSGDDATLHIGTGSDIGSLNVTGDLDLNVAGVLDLDSATSSGNTVLHHRGLAGTALRYGDLNVGSSLSVTGPGNWSGNDASVGGDATYDVGSADLHSLVSNTGKLSLDALGLFAADVLNSKTRSVVLQAGSADLGAVNAGTILQANTNGNLSIASGRSVNDLTLTTTAGSLGTIRFGEPMDPNVPGVLDTAHLKSGENLYVETDGDVFGGNAEAEYLLSIKGRNMTFGRVQSLQEDVSLIAGGLYEEGNGNITGLLVEGKRDVGIIAGGNLTMPEVKFGRAYSLKAGRDLTVGIRGDLNVNGLAEAGRDLLFNIGGNVDLQGIKAGRNVDVTSGGFINLDERIDAGGRVKLLANGGDVTVGSGIYSTGVYDGKALAADVVIDAAGSVSTPEIVAAGGNIDVRGGNSLLIDALNAQGNTDLLAGGLIQVAGISRSGTDQRWNAGSSIDFGHVLAGGSVDLKAVADITGDEVDGSLIKVDGRNLRIADLTSATTNDLLAGGLIQVAGISRSGTDQRWTADSSIDFGRVLAGGSVDLKAVTDITGDEVDGSLIKIAGHSLRFTDLTSDTDTEMLARGLIRINGTSQSGGNQNWHADDSIFFERLLAGGQALLDSMLTTQGTVLRADQGATINAGWRNGVASNADILLGQATAPTLSLWAGKLIRVADANIGQATDLHGQDIELYGRHTGSGQLNLWVEGSGQALAQRFDTRLQAADIVSPRLHVVDSRIQTSGSKVDLQDAVGVDHLALYSAQAVIIADNTTPTYRQDADVQLYELDKAFQLKQDGLTSTTSAYVLHRKSTHQVLVQNFSEAHAAAPGEGMLYQGISAARYSEQNLSGAFTEKRIAGLRQPLSPVLPISSGWTPGWNAAPMETRMNLDMGATAPADDGAEAWEL